MSDHRYLWVFEVSAGGEPCEVRVKGNPPMRYVGERDLLRCICTDAEADELQKVLETKGVKVMKHSPRETEEQTEERRNVFTVLGENTALWPTALCPGCSWFDPSVEGMCGAGLADLPGWSIPAIRERMQVLKFAEDHKVCPLNRTESN